MSSRSDNQVICPEYNIFPTHLRCDKCRSAHSCTECSWKQFHNNLNDVACAECECFEWNFKNNDDKGEDNDAEENNHTEVNNNHNKNNEEEEIIQFMTLW